MATPNFMGTPAKSAVPQNEWLARQLMIQRQMQAADAMQQQAMEAIPTNRSVGGVAIPISPMEGVGQMAKALSSRYQQQTAASEMEKLDAKRREDLANKLREYSDMRAGGVRNRPDMSGEGMTGGLDEQDYGRKPEMVPGDPRAAMVMALTSQHPELHQLGALDARALGETPYAKIDPSKYTPDSIQRFAASGGKDYTALVPRDKLELQNTGGAIVPFNPYSGNPVGSGFPTTQTPNNVATLGQQDRHWGNLSANQIEQDRRAREQIEIARRNSDIAGGRLQNDSTNTYFNTGMPGANVPGGGGVPAPAPSPAPLPQQGGVDPNNLGNIRPPGQSTGFQRFNTPQEGLAAIDQNLQAYGAKGINTIEKIISTWAPPSENNTQAYVASVAQRLGINPQQPLDMNNPAVRHALTTAIMIHEKGPQAIFGTNQVPARGGGSPVTPSPTPVLPPRAQAEIESDRRKKMNEREGAREFNMGGLRETIDSARKILSPPNQTSLGGPTSKRPTESIIGTAADYIGSAIGVSPRGAAEADQLRAIGAQLISKMPRMEGPQSDKDVALYREAAGRIGDSMIPIARRLEALKTVEELYAKYDKRSEPRNGKRVVVDY